MAMQFSVMVEIEGSSPDTFKLGLSSLTKKDQVLNSTPITICPRMSPKGLEPSP